MKQQPTEGELDLLFEAMYDDYFGGQPSSTTRTIPPAQEPQVRQSSTASTTIADNVPIPTNSSSLVTNILSSLQVVDELNPNAMIDGNMFVNPFATSSSNAADTSSSMDVWVLVLAPDNISPLTLKWIFKNKHDEEKTVIRNKSRLVVRGYRQEEGLDFEESFAPDSGFELTGFSDAGYAGCKDSFKSTSGGAQFLGEKLVSWSSKKQDCTTLSTVEVKYVSLSACCAQVLWMQTQLTDYGFIFKKIPIYCDSKSAIAISSNPVQHSRTKHIAVRYHFIKEDVEKDADYAGCKDSFKSNFDGAQFLGEKLLNSTLAKITKQMTSITSLCEMACKFVQKNLEEKQLKEERAAKDQNWKIPFYYDDDDDEERSDSLDDNIISGLPPFSAITPNEPVLSIEEPDNSLSIGDEYLDTIPATESDEVIKSSIEDLIPILSEFEGIPDHKCDVPSHDNSPPLDVSKYQFEASPPDSELVSSKVMEIVIPKVGGIDADILLIIKDDILRENLLNVNHIFAKIDASNDNPILFYDPIISGTPSNLTLSGECGFFLEVDAFLAVEDEPTSSQFPQSYLDLEGDVLEKIISKPLFEQEIIPMKIDLHPDNVESDLIESLRTHDSFLQISSKIDSLLEEFVGELTLLKSIPPRINETDCDFEEDIRLIEKLLYDNSSPRPPKEFVSANSDAKIKSFSPSHILVKDIDSLMEEIDLFYTLDYPMPPGIMDEHYDSERDIFIRKDLPSNNTLSFAKKESFHFVIPSFSRPPTKPPDGNTGILNIKMMSDISDQTAFMHKLMITLASD
nr:retrovirus-related Pol polyprotein from transposon TNT 1-94 [Tanacetum cinerariifolium]